MPVTDAEPPGAPAFPHAGLRVSGPRLMDRLAALAEVGAIEGGGVCRLALTDADRAGRDLVVAWMTDLGMDVEVDAVGNVVATRPGRRADAPPIMTGSHIDTVRTGGRYDGNLGVLAGLEVVETLASAGVLTEHPLAVAFFTDEEGARFAPDMLGSLVYAGGMPLEQALDTVAIDGARLGDELQRIGYAGPHPCPGAAPAAFVELHIEQGPVLEADGVTIGAVTGVQGISWQEVTITGQSNHAGTTPMGMRRDAGYAAARLAVAVREIASQADGQPVGTVGSIQLFPDLVNVVAARATITVDLRNTDAAALRAMRAAFDAAVAAVAREEQVEITSRVTADFDPVEFDDDVVAMVEDVATSLGHSVCRMPSGAGHDAQMLARMCPTAMIFVPSVGGLSHNPAEHTDADDLEAGANVLLQTLLRLDASMGAGTGKDMAS